MPVNWHRKKVIYNLYCHFTQFSPVLLSIVTECSKENEAVKLIRMKQSLIKISESYLELAHKCIHIFEAQREVAIALPDVQDANVESIKYTGKYFTLKIISLKSYNLSLHY